MVLDEYTNGDLIEAKTFNSRIIRTGTRSEIEAIPYNDINVGDAFYDTTRHSWVIVSRKKDNEVNYTFFSNLIYKSDIKIGYNTQNNLIRKIRISNDDLFGDHRYFLISARGFKGTGSGGFLDINFKTEVNAVVRTFDLNFSNSVTSSTQSLIVDLDTFYQSAGDVDVIVIEIVSDNANVDLLEIRSV